MSRSFEELNTELAALHFQFNNSPDNQERVLIMEEMRAIFDEMRKALATGNAAISAL